MGTLSVVNFSCLEKAKLELAPFMLLIGPQASGKSVLSKLIYFFYDIIGQQYSALEDDNTSAEWMKRLADDFQTWFPASAWGPCKFKIRFEAGPVHFEVTRKTVNRQPSEEVSVKFSDFFTTFHDDLVGRIRARRISKNDSEDLTEPDDFDIVYQAWQSGQKRLAEAMGSDYARTQTFIPAGRAFFTSLGKAFVAFEQGGMLDPVTTRFGRTLARLRERGNRALNPRLRAVDEDGRSRHALMQSLFGGALKNERGKEFVETEDGRRVPISALSSGQQELLPLWIVLSGVADAVPNRPETARRMVYIEEPEAHLFPDAQSTLIEYLASLTRRPDAFKLLITTHSPYVLAKVNNLLKAGSLGEDVSKAVPVREVVGSSFWLQPENTRAYAIKGRKVVNIMSDGLIDGEYLDHVSLNLEREFSALLEIEYPL